MRYASLFSGIEAASVAWHGATVRTSESRICYAATHMCTHPDCNVVFNAAAARPWKGKVPS